MSLRRALIWTAFWISLSLLFACGVWLVLGGGAAVTWLSAYLVEKLLSFDNLFMFYVIFRFFNTTPADQRRALNWGTIGAAVMRGIILFAGTTAIAAAPWLLYICGAFLFYSGVKMMFAKDDGGDEAPEGMINRLRRWLPAASMLFITIATVELTDVLFALDSIPAAFGITSNLFLLATSNLFAVLGLRSMYFAMLAAIEKFHFLKKGVSLILSGIGMKMLLAPLIAVPTPFTFAFVVATLAISILLSAMKEYALKPRQANDGVMKSVCTFFFKPPSLPVEIEMTEIKTKEQKPCLPSLGS